MALFIIGLVLATVALIGFAAMIFAVMAAAKRADVQAQEQARDRLVAWATDVDWT